MTFIFWLQFASVCIAGAMSPGPSLALIIRNSVKINRFAGLMTSIGHGLGKTPKWVVIRRRNSQSSWLFIIIVLVILKE